MLTHPPFGQADLSNCERELIHLAGSVQPHGLLLAVREVDWRIVQASANAEALLGAPATSLLRQPLAELGGNIAARVRECADGTDLAVPAPLECSLSVREQIIAFEGMAHRVAGGLLLIELEPLRAGSTSNRVDRAGVLVANHPVVELPGPELLERLDQAVQRFSAASTTDALADAVVQSFSELFGYDRSMVYQFDPDGHGKIIAEAREPHLEPLLGYHYPASDIPQRARELYLRNRVRVLVDVQYEAAPLVPRRALGSDAELDMSLCHLRSMSPLHLQYLKNMGVAATLVVSIAREERLWGLIACHHGAPRNLRFTMRAAADLLGEVVATRIAAIDHQARARVSTEVRRLEQRLVEATATEGDWRLALFRNPRTLLQPLEATAAALFYDGEVLTTGAAPAASELRALLQWVDAQPHDGLFASVSLARDNPALRALAPTASGVLAVKLSASKPDYLMWLREEQLHTITWAGDPNKAALGDDPMDLSPRRSFQAWSEIVRGTAMRWSAGETRLARAFGASLADIIVQINAVRLLIVEHQMAQIRSAMVNSHEPVLIADTGQRLLFSNDAFARLVGQGASQQQVGAPLYDPDPPSPIADLFSQPELMRKILAALARDRQAWRGEMALRLPAGATVPVMVRAEVVPARDGSVLGFFFMFTDLTESQRAQRARRQLEASLTEVSLTQTKAQTPTGPKTPRLPAPASRRSRVSDLTAAILINASLAAIDIDEGLQTPGMAPLLEEVEASTRRATALCARIDRFNPDA